MKVLAVILLVISINAHAQTEILSATGNNKNFYPYLVSENASSLFIYRLYQKQIAPSVNNYLIKSYKLLVEKVDKISLQSVQTNTFAGDTLQADSIIRFESPRALLANNHLHLFYCKDSLDYATSIGFPQWQWRKLYYTQLDTSLNITVPERLIYMSRPNTKNIYPAPVSLVQDGSYIVAAISFFDSSVNQQNLAVCVKMDNQGNILSTDTIPPAMTAATNGHILRKMYLLPTGEYLFTGFNLFPTTTQLHQTLVKTSHTFQLLDTFNMKPDIIVTPNLTNGHFNGGRSFDLAFLPSGTTILGGVLLGNTAQGQSVYTTLSTLDVNNRYALGPLNTFGAVDANDLTHDNQSAYNSLIYNTTDHRIYYADATHKYEGTPCSGAINYLQIVSTDTSLQHSWRKFISSNYNYCMEVGGVTSCIGRSGIIVTGTQYLTASPGDTSKQTGFAYRIDSSSNLGIADPAAPITIRNRIATYPNPAKDILTIDDILGHLATATLTNMQGQLIYQSAITGSKATISLKDYPPGLYMLRVKTTDGELYAQKILRL